MRFQAIPMKSIFPYAAGLALVFSTACRADDDMPGVPADVAAVPDDAATTASGLASRVLSEGEGSEHPAAEDRVTVHYSGWTEGLQLMVVGEKRRFWIPADLAYGENPGGGRPGGMLVFDVELLDIVR